MNLDKQNSRKHSDRNKAAIRKSLETAKAARSIVIDSGDNVLAGNGVAEQWEAMGGKVRVVETSGDELVAVKRVDVAPDSPQARQIATLDNLVADTSAFDYDAERLREALANDPVSKAIAEQDERLRKLLKVTKPESVDAGELVDKAAQLQEKWQVKRGDLWQCGKHRILCGDSTNAEDVARLMQGEKAELVFTDPPYGIEYQSSTLETTKIIGDDKNIATFLGFVKECDKEVPFYVFCDFRSYPYVYLFCEENKRSIVDVIVWDKTEGMERAQVPPMTLMRWIRSHEFIAYSGKLKENLGYSADVLHYARVYGKHSKAEHDDFIKNATDKLSLIHPTIKPLAVVAKCISAHEDASIIYDPFLGSGTTLIAAEQTGRIGRGVEIEPKYVAVSLERLSNLGLTCERIEKGNP